jgi:hypothetical protein
VHQGAHAREWQAGELGQRFLEHFEIAGEQRTQHQAGGQLPACAQMPDQRPDLAVGGDRRERNGGFFAGLLGDALGVVAGQPFACRNEARERLGKLGDQPVPRRRRQVGAREHGFTYGSEMPEPINDPIE